MDVERTHAAAISARTLDVERAHAAATASELSGAHATAVQLMRETGAGAKQGYKEKFHLLERSDLGASRGPEKKQGSVEFSN